MSHRILACTALAAAIVISGCATKPPAKPMHPEVLNAIRNIQSVAILPMEVQITQVVFTGDNERMSHKEERFASALSPKLDQIVTLKKYAIRKPTSDQPEQARAMEFELQQLRAALGAAFKQATKTDNEETRPRYSVGAAASPLASRMNADALLLTRYSGFKKSGGQQTKDAVTSVLLAGVGILHVSSSQGGILSAVLIEGATGEVLWTGATRMAPILPESAADAAPYINDADGAFTTFPSKGAVESPAAGAKANPTQDQAPSMSK